ncbi:MAG: response regulator, partial [Nitrososphaeraceae archaeon]
MEEFNRVDNMATSKPLNILIAEDEPDIAILYKTVLEKRNHKATITTNGEDCLKAYHEVSQSNRFATDQSSVRPGPMNLSENHPFDVVVLDCKMPHINGIEVAKEILALNPHQRIIFASAYIKDTVIDSIKNLKHVMMESVQKPFEMKRLIDLIEDKMVYQELKRLNVDIDIIKAVNPTHEQVSDLLERLQNIRNTKSNEKG